MSTVPMQIPSGTLGVAFALPGATYISNASGQIFVAPSDVPFAIAGGCQFANFFFGVAASTAAAGTNQGTAAALPTLAGDIYPVSGASGTNGVILGAADAVPGRSIWIANQSSSALLIYPPSGGTIGGGAANAAFTTVAGHGALIAYLGFNAWTVLG